MPTLINRLLSHRDRLAEAVRFVEHLGVRPGLSAFWRSRNGRPANSSESGSLDVDVASLARPLTQVLVDLAAHFGADADPIGLSIALPRVDGDLDARAALDTLRGQVDDFVKKESVQPDIADPDARARHQQRGHDQEGR